jgi:hypothetical protein
MRILSGIQPSGAAGAVPLDEGQASFDYYCQRPASGWTLFCWFMPWTSFKKGGGGDFLSSKRGAGWDEGL